MCLICNLKHFLFQDTFEYKYVPSEERENEDNQNSDASKKRVSRHASTCIHSCFIFDGFYMIETTENGKEFQNL